MKYLIIGDYYTFDNSYVNYIPSEKISIPLLFCDTLEEAKNNLLILHTRIANIIRREIDGCEEIEDSIPSNLWIKEITNKLSDVEIDINPYENYIA